MHHYYFILGKNPILSLTEIISCFKRDNIEFVQNLVSSEVATFKTLTHLDAASLIHTLGGTIKIGTLFDSVHFDDDEQKLDAFTSSEFALNNLLPKNTKGKFHVGISLYDAGVEASLLRSLQNKLKPLNQSLKENLREQGVSMGFVQQKERYLSSVSVEKNQLLSKGAEIVLLATSDSVWIGKTLAVQEFEQFSFRDYGRPFRDKRSGIMPPKLARMMLNIAQTEKKDILLDPFCGSGTVIQEALLLNHKNIIGTDISNKAIGDTQNNIDWLFKYFLKKEKSDNVVNIFECDVRNLDSKISPSTVSTIVTEPFLGPPLFQNPTAPFIEETFRNLSALYLDAFAQFKKVLTPFGKIVIVFPFYEVQGKLYFLEILERIQSLGFKVVNIIPSVVPVTDKKHTTPRNSILFADQFHFVKREILCFEKTAK